MKLTDNSPFKMNSVLMLNKQSLSSKNIKLKKLNPDLPSVKYLFKKKRESIPKLRLYNKTDTNSITSQQLFKLTQSSMNENSNSTALDIFNEPSSALSYRKIDMYNNKARLIKKTIYLDTKLMDTDDNEYKRRVMQEKDNEIYNDVIEDKDKGNKQYNEQQLESMRTSTKRILKELNCIQKINPYIAYVGGDTVKRIFSIKIDSTFDDDSGKDHN